MPRNPLETFELKLSYLMPIFLILGALINLDITSSPTLPLHGFAQVQVRPASFADYNQDPAGLIFPAIDPEIIQDVNNDAINFDGSSQATSAATSNSATASATNLPGTQAPNPTSTLPASSTSTLQASPTQFISTIGVLTLVPTLTPLVTLVPTLPLPTLPISTLPLPTLPLPTLPLPTCIPFLNC